MITVAIGVSPKGKKCIVMTMEDGTQWILLTTKRAPLASSLSGQLQSDFSVESLPGIPLDWRQSLAQNELTFATDSGCIGVYVQADRFDELANELSGL